MSVLKYSEALTELSKIKTEINLSSVKISNVQSSKKTTVDISTSGSEATKGKLKTAFTVAYIMSFARDSRLINLGDGKGDRSFRQCQEYINSLLLEINTDEVTKNAKILLNDIYILAGRHARKEYEKSKNKEPEFVGADVKESYNRILMQIEEPALSLHWYACSKLYCHSAFELDYALSDMEKLAESYDFKGYVLGKMSKSLFASQENAPGTPLVETDSTIRVRYFTLFEKCFTHLKEETKKILLEEAKYILKVQKVPKEEYQLKGTDDKPLFPNITSLEPADKPRRRNVKK